MLLRLLQAAFFVPWWRRPLLCQPADSIALHLLNGTSSRLDPIPSIHTGSLVYAAAFVTSREVLVVYRLRGWLSVKVTDQAVGCVVAAPSEVRGTRSDACVCQLYRSHLLSSAVPIIDYLRRAVCGERMGRGDLLLCLTCLVASEGKDLWLRATRCVILTFGRGASWLHGLLGVILLGGRVGLLVVDQLFFYHLVDAQ